MEDLNNSQDTPKDEAMKSNIEASEEDTEKKDTKKSKKTAKDKPIIEAIEAPETEPKPSLFKALGLDKIFEAKEEVTEPSEDAEIIETYVQANTPAAAEELDSSEPGTEDEVLAAASLAYLEALGAAVDDQEEFSEETLDEAADEALLALGVTEVETPTEESKEPAETPKPPKQKPTHQTERQKAKNETFSKKRVKAAKPVTLPKPIAAPKPQAQEAGAVAAIEKPQPPKHKVEKIHKAIVKKEIQVRQKAVEKFREVTVKKSPEDHELKPAIEIKETALEQMISPKQIDSMKLALVLQIASEISLDGVSLRTMYEKGSVDQKNLRLILKQYLRGKRLDKIWPKPLAEQAFSQEHADRPFAEQAPVASAGQATVQQIAPIEVREQTPQANYQPPQNPAVEHKIKEILEDDVSKPTPSYVPLIILAVLAVLIIALLLT